MTTTRRGSPGCAVSIALALVALVGCSQPATGGSLAISFAGVPPGASRLADVTGPNGYATQVTSAQTLTDLTPGTYEIIGVVVSAPSSTSDGEERFAAEAVSATVSTAQITLAQVSYAYAGLTITDAQDDAQYTIPTPAQYVYDVIELWTEVAGTELIINMEYRTDQTDLSEAWAILYLDVDQNDATGTGSELDGFCSGGTAIGSEFALRAFGQGSESIITTYPGGAVINEVTRSAANSRVTFTLPLSAIGGVRRVDMELIVGNADQVTDCLARGTVV